MPKLDVPGALTAVTRPVRSSSTGFAHAADRAAGARTVTLLTLAAGTALLIAFVAIQARSEHPLLPLRVVLDRDRGGSFAAIAIVGSGMFGVFLFLTYYLQRTLGFSPLTTGLAFLPMMASIMPDGDDRERAGPPAGPARALSSRPAWCWRRSRWSC